MIDVLSKNYYLALLFEERPELHMTMRYWKKLKPSELVRKMQETEANLLKNQEVGNPTSRFKVEFPRCDVFGWANKVDVMRSLPTQGWPEFILSLVDPKTVETFHVTCNDKKPLTLTACAVAIMRRKEEVFRWNLS